MGEQDTRYACLRLDSQLCFPLYAASKETIRRYKPFLDRLNLTYTQYITMMVLWEHQKMNVKELGEKPYLDSGTLTPVLKKLESKGYLTRSRSEEDERNLIVTITDTGRALEEDALMVPREMGACVHLEKADAEELYQLLYKLLAGFQEADGPQKTDA